MKGKLSFSYESTSSDDSSSESSDEGSDSSEYHEAREKLPEPPVQHQHTTLPEAPLPQEQHTSAPQQPAAKPPDSQQHRSTTLDTRQSGKPPQSPATDTTVQKCASDSPSSPPCPAQDSVEQLSENTPEITSTLPTATSTPGQNSIKPSATCSSTTSVNKGSETAKQETPAPSGQPADAAAPFKQVR